MARGNDAKLKVIQKISEAFGSDFIGEVDKKIYVWADENGEKIQIAITLTCPKTQVAVENKPSDNKMDFSTPIMPKAPVEISDEEKKNLNELMERLGL